VAVLAGQAELLMDVLGESLGRRLELGVEALVALEAAVLLGQDGSREETKAHQGGEENDSLDHGDILHCQSFGTA
jgi:hypothetical protein